MIAPAIAIARARRRGSAPVSRLFAALSIPVQALGIYHILCIKFICCPLFAAWWFNPAQAGAAANALIGLAMTVALGYVAIAGVFDKRRQQLDKEKLAAEVERIRTIDAANKETLAGQMAEIKAKAERDAAESKANQELMRRSLHEIRNQAQRNATDAGTLRLELHAAHADSVALSGQLREANARIAALIEELAEANRRISELTRQVAQVNRESAERGAKVDSLVSDVRAQFGLTPDPDATPPPP